MIEKGRLWLLVLSALMVAQIGSACTEDKAAPVPVPDETPETPDVTEAQALRPSFELGQTWVVGSIYRSTNVKTPEDAIAVPGEIESALGGSGDLGALMPREVVPADGTNWTSPVFWRFGVINTNYTPEDGSFAELARDEDGTVQPITILKAVAPKELNDRGISDGLDPVFYLVLRESDMRVRGIHYNYKVRDGRNTVVLELPETGGEKAPGADLDYFLVDYMMPIFPLAAADDTIVYGPQGAGFEMTTRKLSNTSAEATFQTALDRKVVTQRWSKDQPWFDTSVTDTRRSWRLDDAALTTLLEASGTDYYTNDQFLEPVQTIEAKFRNRFNVGRTLRVEAGTIESRTPDSHLPWAGYWFPLTDSATTFGWDGTDGRRKITGGPATSLQEDIDTDLGEIDDLLQEILDMDRDAEERPDKIKLYWEKKEAVATKIRDHFEHPETGVVARYQNGELSLDEVNNFGPLEKYGLYLLANKITDHPFEAAIWEITKQYNPKGESWWGKCNGWAAASVLTNEPRESVTVQLDLANISGDEGTLNMDFTTGDLKSLSASLYYGTRSNFYGSRYYGDDDERGNNYQDIAPDVFHRIINFYIGEEKYPMVFDLTANEQVWNYSCYAFDSRIGEVETLDEGTKGINLATKAELVEAGASEEAAQAIFDRVRSTKGPFAELSELDELEAVTSDDVSKLSESNMTLWGERQAHRVETDLHCATDGVSEDHIDTPGADPNGFTKNYTYNLVVAEDGTIIRGEWTNGSIEDHPDFAWVPYANEVRRSSATPTSASAYERHINNIYWGRFAPSENAFLFTDIFDDLIDVRVNAPVVCNVAPDDCGDGMTCNPLDGTCEEADIDVPVPTDDCIGGTKTAPAAEVTNGLVCSGRDAFFAIDLEEGQKVEITVAFAHADGDIDIELQNPDGKALRSSTSTGDAESVLWTAEVTGAHLLRVYGYSGAENAVTIDVNITTVEDSPTCAEEAGEPNNNIDSGSTLEVGTHDANICGSDSDFYMIAAEGDWTVTITFVHSDGDLDLKSYDAEANQTKVSQGTDNTETVAGSGPGFVEVYGYDGATGSYTITME